MNLQRREINGCGLIKKCKEKKKAQELKWFQNQIKEMES